MYRFRGLAAVVAVAAALALMLIPSAGAHTEPGPVIDHCHWWPGHTRVHWHNTWVTLTFGFGARVDSVTFSWDDPFPADVVVGPDGSGEGATAVTPVGALHANAVLSIQNGIFHSSASAPQVACVFHP